MAGKGPEGYNHDMEGQNQKPEQLGNMDNPKYIDTFAQKIDVDAKKISPESSSKLDIIKSTYEAEMANIDKTETDPKIAEKKREQTTNEYIKAIRTEVGITEGSEAKLVEDGKNANKKLNQSNENETKDWKESLKKLTEQVAKKLQEVQNKKGEDARAVGLLAQQRGNTESQTAQNEAPKIIDPWPTDMA